MHVVSSHVVLECQFFFVATGLHLCIFVEQRLEVVYGPIRYKMATALNNWHPSDSSAHKILEPWVKVSATSCRVGLNFIWWRMMSK